ncbi:hypothetical protein KGV52_00540, partial [Candidatus Gracilibacteria bacterium]|nr:hypothetical protein [Candidatus Gracilibacteria bacterium]
FDDNQDILDNTKNKIRFNSDSYTKFTLDDFDDNQDILNNTKNKIRFNSDSYTKFTLDDFDDNQDIPAPVTPEIAYQPVYSPTSPIYNDPEVDSDDYSDNNISIIDESSVSVGIGGTACQNGVCVSN